MAPEGAMVHLFVSDEWPDEDEGIHNMILIEPWEYETYHPKPFSFGPIKFEFAHDEPIKAYGYFVRDNATGGILFVERFRGAPCELKAGGSIAIDLSSLYLYE